MLIAVLVPFALGAFFLLASILPVRRLRGVGLTAVVMAQCLAWSPVVPQNVKDAVIVATLLFLTLLALSPRQRRARPAHSPTLLPMTILLFGCSLVTTQLANPDGVGLVLRLGALASLIVVVVRQFDRDDVLAFRRGMVVNALVQTGLGLAEFLLTHRPILWGYKVYTNGQELHNENHLLGDSVARIQGSLGHAIPFAAIITLGIVFLIVDWRRFARPAAFTCLLLLVTALILSGSRSAILAAIISTTFLLLKSDALPSRRRGALIVAAAAAGAVLNADTISAQIDGLFGSGSFSNRQDSLSSIPLLLDRPLAENLWGSGAATQPSLFAQGLLVSSGFNVVDNQLVTTLATQGLIGATLLLLLFLVGLRRGDASSRAAVITMAVLLFSFDYFVFTSMVTPLFAVLALPRLDVSPSGEMPVETARRSMPSLPRSREVFHSRETTSCQA